MHKTILGFTALVATTAASAGTYVESAVTNSMTPQPTPTAAKMWFDGSRFRLEMAQGKQVQIFKDRTIYSLDVGAKTYSKIDKASLDAMMQKAKKATDDLQALMPPEARKKEQPKPAMDRAVKATGRTETGLGQSCKVWEVLVNGAKVQEMCVVDVNALPNGKEYLQTMQQMSDSFKGSPGAGDGAADVLKMNGIPVIQRMFMNGKLFQEVKTTVFRAAPTNPDMFAIPAGFKEKQVGEM
jgi:hypothetical protein